MIRAMREGNFPPMFSSDRWRHIISAGMCDVRKKNTRRTVRRSSSNEISLSPSKTNYRPRRLADSVSRQIKGEGWTEKEEG